MKLGSWNEKNNPDLPDWQVRSDARKVKRRFRGASIISVQEAAEREDRVSIRSVFGLLWQMIGGGESTPILLKRGVFRVLGWEYVKCHGGIRGRSPHRGYVKAHIKRRRRPRLKPFWVYSTHLISKPDQTEETQALWDKHVEVMRADVARTREETGEDQFVLGDFNRGRPPRLHPDQVVLVHNWLDAIIWIPGTNGNRVREVEEFVMHGLLYTDHKPIGTRISLKELP